MAKEVIRKCIVSGETVEKDDLLRFTAIEGQLIPDFSKKLPGKGIYVRNSRAVLEQAILKKSFSRVSKSNLKEGLEILEIVEKLLINKALNSINLSKKAGILISGFEKVKELIISGNAAFLHEAIDVGSDGAKILSLAKAVDNIEVFSLYTTKELDFALDKVNTVHIGFKKSDMATRVYKDFTRLRDFKKI